MIKEQAIVIDVSDNSAKLEMQRQSACSHCELSHGCGTGAIGRLLGKRSKPVTVKLEQNIKIGDEVELGLPEGAFLTASLLIYGLPLLGLFIAAVLAEIIFTNSDSMVFIFAISGLIIGLCISAGFSKAKLAGKFTPKILTVTRPSAELSRSES